MFTGIVEDIGSLVRIIPRGNGAHLVISTALPLLEVKLGDSIAVCGACLTVVRTDAGLFEAEISRETATRSTLAGYRSGTRLHLERAMRLSDRLDGHLVLGHVDGIGTLTGRVDRGDSLELEFSAPADVHRYLVEKGSIGVHGVSLTVNRIHPEGFGVTLVGLTREKTFLGDLALGTQVNLEADVMAKFVERLLRGRLDQTDTESGSSFGRKGEKEGGLTLEQLARGGFLK